MNPWAGALRRRTLPTTGRWLVLVLLLSALWGPATARATEGEAAVEATRILLVGDSITHGSAGDWTWRYFAWKHLREVNAPVNFVGPRRGVHRAPGSAGPARYADRRFDRDHAAMWGDRIVQAPKHDRDALVRTYRPDIVVLALGTNDLVSGWSPRQVVRAVRGWVTSARAIRAGTAFVLSEVPGSTAPRAGGFNRALHKIARRLDAEESPVTVARTARGFRTGTGHGSHRDTYDPLHPNARGQVRIAAAVTDALARLGVGKPYPRPLEFAKEGPRTRPALEARPLTSGARVRWALPAGGTSVDVWIRPPTGAWQRLAVARVGTSARVRGLVWCGTYDFRVRARKGWTLAHADMTSRVRSVRVTAGCV